MENYWNLHPRADYFLERGGDEIPPPLFCNLSLTNKCNLRCEICGSQKSLDASKTPRRDMPFEVFQKVSETLFPVLAEVELNSRGEPTLYPKIARVIETIYKHECMLKLQSNGTLLSDRLTDIIISNPCFLYFSIDAVGPLFDEVRRFGRWEDTEPRLRRLMNRRDPSMVGAALYPTVTGRTVGNMIHVLRWATDLGFDIVAFHDYHSVQHSTERMATPEEKKSARDEILDFLAKTAGCPTVTINNDCLHQKGYSVRIPSKRPRPQWEACYPVPDEASNAHPEILCLAPYQNVDIDLGGEVSACCRSQDVALGMATSVEEFAQCWLGDRYQKIRESLRRGSNGMYPLQNCYGCVETHAPQYPSRPRPALAVLNA